MTHRLIHPTDWTAYLRYATHQRGTDWRPPLVSFAVAKLQQAADSLTPRQIGLFVLFVCGYAESPLLDPEAGHRSARAFADRPATWKRRVGHKVTSDDVDAWTNAALVETTTVGEPPADLDPTADERAELERGLDRGRDREQRLEQEPEPEPDHEHEHEHERENGREAVRGRTGGWRSNPSLRASSSRLPSSADRTDAGATVCEECGLVHEEGFPPEPDDPFYCQLNAVMDGYHEERIDAYRLAAGKSPWKWPTQKPETRS
jgi:hypothetical protein